MKTTQDTVERLFARMIAAFGSSRVEKPTAETLETWWILLKDVDDAAVLAAGLDLLSEPREWPPTPGQVRDRAIDIQRGQLVPVSPTEAWERALAAARGDQVQLSQNEQRALKVAGGAWAIKSANVESTRFVFMDHYRALCTAEKRRAVTIPKVATAANLNAPALPEAKRESVPRNEQINRGTPEQVGSLLDGYVLREQMDKGV